MRRVLVISALALVASIEVAQAASITFSGSIWENQPGGAATDASPAAVPTTTPDVTFTTTVTYTTIPVINFSAGVYTIGGFLFSNPSNNSITTIDTGSSQLNNTLANTIFNFTGTVSLTAGQTYVTGSDDGMTLIINGAPVISSPGEQGFSLKQYIWNGATGTFPFQMVYAENNIPPAQLFVEGLGLTNNPPAAPGPVPGAGLAGLAALALAGPYVRTRRA